MIKKQIFLVFLILISINLISAINLDVSTKPIQNSAIIDLDEPAVFELTIRNLEEKDSFEIYSLVGIDISPKTSFIIDSGKTKILKIKAMPQESLGSKKGPFTFEYKIKDSQNKIQVEKLTINIIGLKDALSISAENINPNSEKTTIIVKNKLNYDFKEIKAKIQSAFFDFEETFSLAPSETKEFELPIDSEKLKTYVAGPYLLNSQITTQDITTNIESIIKFLEQEGIETIDSKEGFLIKRTEISKTNVGNVVKTVEITAEKNVLSYLFTTFNIVPHEVERNGFKINYVWKKELIPNEELKIIVKTNWFYPIIIVLFVICLFLLIKRYVESDLILKKKVSFVKTRGGEFALKITLKAKAKKFIERINVIDKLPHLVKLYERYGAIAPDKVDLKNHRMEWNIESLNKDEERIFTYIIYSKIGIVGRFELPCAKAIYEKEGKIKEVESNRSFFINEPTAR